MGIVVQIALNAVIAGAIYTLVAVGFSLIYSAARFFDLGYGALAVAGGYSVLYFYDKLGLSLVPAIVLGVLIAAVLGVACEYCIYRPLRARKSSNTVMLVVSLGVLTVVQAVIAILFTSQFQTLSKDVGSERIFSIFGGAITETQVVILAAALAIMAALALVLKYSLFGKAVRAVADDEEVANIVGIDSKKIMMAVFAIGSAIGAVAGIGTGFDTGLQPTVGLTLLLKGVVAAIIGGIGSIWGAALGAFLLALIENLGAWQFSGEWKDAIAFAVLIVFLLFRPQGILGKKK
jgi:branched-chain amino acid transport system permease protein